MKRTASTPCVSAKLYECDLERGGIQCERRILKTNFEQFIRQRAERQFRDLQTNTVPAPNSSAYACSALSWREIFVFRLGKGIKAVNGDVCGLNVLRIEIIY